MRLTGMLVGMKEICPQLENCQVTYLDGDGKLGESFEAMRRHLRTARARAPDRRDQRSERARRACARCRKPDARTRCAIMGQNASPEGRAELRQPRHAPHRLGRVLSRRSTAPRSSPSRSTSSTAAPVPPAVFVKHQLVTPENVDHIYPNDQLMQISAGRLPGVLRLVPECCMEVLRLRLTRIASGTEASQSPSTFVASPAPRAPIAETPPAARRRPE